MLVYMYRVESLDKAKGDEICDAVGRTQLEFVGSPGSLGQRLRRDGRFRDLHSCELLARQGQPGERERDACRIGARAVNALGVRTGTSTYEVVQEL